MFDTKRLLDALRARGLSNAEISRAVGLPSSRIAEIFGGRRQVKLDEAKRLVEAFQLEERLDDIDLLNADLARLLVLHVSRRVGDNLSPDDPIVQELAEDLAAFARFVQRQGQPPSPATAEGFLAGRDSGTPVRH
jgi:cyanate lyase